MIAALASAYAFVGLNSSSMWLDELFTAYFADPQQQSLAAVLFRAAEDVHPPGYYLLVNGFTKLGGDFAFRARMLSAIFAVCSLFLLYFALPEQVGRFGRLFACAFAATSEIWFDMSQEARSYALCFVISTAFLWLGLRIKSKLQAGVIPTVLLGCLTVTGVLGGLTHYYLVLLAGGVTSALILLAQTWRQKLAVAAYGLAVLPSVVAFIAWHRTRIVADTSDLWFSADPIDLAKQTISGLKILVGSEFGLALFLLLMVLYLLGYLRSTGPVAQRVQHASTHIWLITSCLVTVVSGVLVTVFFVPSYSSRVFIVLAPFFWAFAGLIMDTTLSRSRHVPAVVGLIVAALCILSLKVLWRGLPIKQEWRASAEYVESLHGCAGATVPVVTYNQKMIERGGTSRFYGYYMRNPQSVPLLEIPRHRLTEMLETEPLSNVLKRRIDGPGKCPIVLWSVHHLTREKIDAFAATVAENFDVPAHRRLHIVDFQVENPSPPPLGALFSNPPMNTFVLVVENKSGP